jgi:hypothetical protein
MVEYTEKACPLINFTSLALFDIYRIFSKFWARHVTCGSNLGA